VNKKAGGVRETGGGKTAVITINQEIEEPWERLMHEKKGNGGNRESKVNKTRWE